MYRRVQPAMQVGGGAARPLPDEPDNDIDWDAPGALTRGWALTRLVMLVVACGVGAAVALAIVIAAIATALGNI